MFRRNKSPLVSTKDECIKIFNERINFTEKHVNEMCISFNSCTRKLAKYRDSYDELAQSVSHYVEGEALNFTMITAMKNLTKAITVLGDYMDLNVHRMEIKVLNELSQFENVCKNARENLRTALVVRDKEVLKQHQMLELKSKFNGNNAAADSELLKVTFEVNRTNKEIDEIVSNFEKHKLATLKSILSDFVLLSMKYHTKSLEALSAACYDITNIDEKDDYRVFQNLVKVRNDAELESAGISKKKMTPRSQSVESLDRDKLLNPLININKWKLSKSTKNLNDSFENDEGQKMTNSLEDDKQYETNENDEEDNDDDVDEEDSEDSYTYDDEGDSTSDKSNKTDVVEQFKSQFNPVNLRKLQYPKPGIKQAFKASSSNSWNKVFKPVKPLSASRGSNSGLVRKRLSSSTAGIPHHQIPNPYNQEENSLFRANIFKTESSSGANTETTSLTVAESLRTKADDSEH